MTRIRSLGSPGARRVAAALLGTLALAACGSVSPTTTVGSHSAAASTTTAPATTTPQATAAVPLAAAAAQVSAELRGIPQRGLVLGRPTAPVTIVEYGDLLCSTCAAVHNNVVPKLIADYVRSGRATLELRPVVVGSASEALARAAYSAGVQGRGWQFVQLAYRRSGIAGSATEPARALASALGLDLRRWHADIQRASWKVDIAGALDVVRVAGFGSFPVFLVARAVSDITKAPPPYVVLTAPTSIRSFDRAITEALAKHD
jgi:protein-disulfide isomerase